MHMQRSGRKHCYLSTGRTFELGYHAWSEPAETLTGAARKRGVALVTPRIGEPVEPTLPISTTAWWRALPPLATHCPTGDGAAQAVGAI